MSKRIWLGHMISFAIGVCSGFVSAGLILIIIGVFKC